MGLRRGVFGAAKGAIGGALGDQWKEYFYCESLPADVMAVKGQKRVSGRSVNTQGEDNIISNGSVIAVADGQCMIIVEQGKILDVCSEPGEFTFDSGGEPSLFAGGDLKANALGSLKSVWERFKFGGAPGMDTRVYYLNTKELIGNKYGTPNPVPFRVVDTNIGLDMDISIKCFGEYSYRIVNPILFYINVCGNVTKSYVRSTIDGQLKTELMTALQPAFARISAMGIRYSALPGHTMEMAEALNEVLSAKWRDLRGLEIVSFGVSSVTADKEDEATIKKLQQTAVYRNPNMAAAALVNAQSEAMVGAANNQNAGPAMAFMGMNMAQQAGGMNAQQLYGMGQQQPVQPQYGAAPDGGFGMAGQQPQQQQYQQPTMQQEPPPPPPAAAPSPAGWKCACGNDGNTGKFCTECAQPKPVEPDGWTCACGIVNKGKFCMECGQPKPAEAPKYKCDKCGWEPPDPTKAPKFCPECGDVFNENDIV